MNGGHDVCGRRTTAALALSGAFGLAGAYWITTSSQSQLLGAFPNQAVDNSSGSRRVALTFDDGPNEPFTTRLAAILERHEVPATFFQVGKAIEPAPEISAALVSAGHVVANHSYSHQLRRCFGSRTIDDELARTQDVIGEAIGRRPHLFRPPWLVRTAATFASVRRHQLLAVSGTFCHPLEVAKCPSRRIAARAVARSTPGRILIFHDGYNGENADRRRTLDAVDRVIDTLGARGWSFATVDTLLGVPAYID
jgi:peptidoglycan/xylan/chitin deacetylase (PgdA/CDA1 family)